MTNPLNFTHHHEAGTSPLTLLLLHGTGGDERSLVSLARDLAPGARLISPRGKVLEGDQNRFFRRLAEGVFDLDDLRFRANELTGFVADAVQHYGADPAKVVALGYSNGANMAAALLLLHPGVLSGAVLLRPMVPLVPDPVPDLNGVPVFIAAGRQDAMISPDQPEALDKLLRSAGADVTMRWENAGHKLTQADLYAARDWLAAQFGT